MLSVFAVASLTSVAQSQQVSTQLSEAFAGSEVESYLRYVQTLGSRTYPISIRAFSIAELDSVRATDGNDPWRARLTRRTTPHARTWGIISPNLSTTYNSEFPFGGNDGSEWKGRGLTTAIRGGAWMHWGSFSAVFAPVAFRAENQSFELMSNGQTGRLAFSDGSFPLNIDKPQRFGADSYSRADFGESTMRVDLRGIGAGVSTASQWWGPATEFPIVLGNNAGGFPHAFIGTSSPANVGFGKMHGRVVYGFLEQSPFSSVTGPSTYVSFAESGTRRFMAGIVGVLQLRGLEGIEIGGTRFFHAANSNNGVTGHNLLLPFQGLLKNSLKTETDTIFGSKQAVKENQLASLFLRIAPPRTGFDLFIEYGREDHSADLRDLLIEPDHSVMSTVGFRKAWQWSRGITAIRGEFLAYDIPSGVRSRLEGDGGAYTHSILRQGHTHKGQLLAADVGPGAGNAQIFSVEQFRPSGHWSTYYRRAVAHETAQRYSSGNPDPRAIDVLNTIGGGLSRFYRDFDLNLGGSVTFDLNRNLTDDRTNFSLSTSVSRQW